MWPRSKLCLKYREIPSEDEECNISFNLLTHVGITDASTPAASIENPYMHIDWFSSLKCGPWPGPRPVRWWDGIWFILKKTYINWPVHQKITSHLESSSAFDDTDTPHSIRFTNWLSYDCNAPWPWSNSNKSTANKGFFQVVFYHTSLLPNARVHELHAKPLLDST